MDACTDMIVKRQPTDPYPLIGVDEVLVSIEFDSNPVAFNVTVSELNAVFVALNVIAPRGFHRYLREGVSVDYSLEFNGELLATDTPDTCWNKVLLYLPQ